MAQSGDSEGISRQANELVLKIRIIEDFVEHDEFQFLINFGLTTLCTAFSFVFAWYAGLLAAVLFFVFKLIEIAFNFFRQPFVDQIEDSYNNTNARLFDVVKNGVKVKVMGQSSYEHRALMEMEEASDAARSKEIVLRLVSIPALLKCVITANLFHRPVNCFASLFW